MYVSTSEVTMNSLNIKQNKRTTLDILFLVYNMAKRYRKAIAETT